MSRKPIRSCLVCAGAGGAARGSARRRPPIRPRRSASIRIARRLIAEGSAEAVAALREGDRARSRRARWPTMRWSSRRCCSGIPRWPEETGPDARPMPRRPGARAADAASPTSFRSPTARRRRGTCARCCVWNRLPFHDASDARLELVTVATAPAGRALGAAGALRPGLARRAAGQGRAGPRGVQRLVVDAPASVTTPRAEVGLARLAPARGPVRRGGALAAQRGSTRRRKPARRGADRVGRRSVALLRARRGDPPRPAELMAHRSPAPGRHRARRRTAGCFLPAASGRSGAALTTRGRLVDRWASRSFRRWRWIPAGWPSPPPARRSTSSRATRRRGPSPRRASSHRSPGWPWTASGRIWVLDRKGESVGRIEPGSGQAVPLAPVAATARLESMVWDGRRLVALNLRDKNSRRHDAEGRLQVVGGSGLLKPHGTRRRAGRTSGGARRRADAILLFDPSGEPAGLLRLGRRRRRTATALGLGWDGAVLLFDGRASVA